MASGVKLSLELLVFWRCWSLEVSVCWSCLSLELLVSGAVGLLELLVDERGALLPHSSMPSASLELNGLLS
jgi:hypothetical protein